MTQTIGLDYLVLIFTLLILQRSRAENIKFMKREITGIKSRRTRVLKDKNL
jgi:hypothetical protein